MQIRALGYLGIQGPDPKAWSDFATGVCGLMAASEEGDDPLRFKLDDRSWRVAVHRARLATAGFGHSAVWLRYFNFVSIVAIK